MPAADWADARAAMLLDPTWTNLNTGSFGPTPRPVFERVTELRRHQAAEPMDFIVNALPPLLWEARRRLAAFLHAESHRLMFAANVTSSINIVASSLALPPGEILLTDHEYGAMHWCWDRAARRLGLTLRTFALPTMAAHPEEIVAAATAAMTDRTRLFFFSHVLSPTGLVLPAKELCQEARRRGILTLIDGAHAPAFVDVNLADIPCDFYGANCHKWLLAPIGCGFLYLAPGSEERLQPLQVSWGWYTTGKSLDAPDEFGSTPRLRRLEFEGTRNICPWLAVPAAIDFQASLGFDRIRRRMAELVAYVRSLFDWLTPATPTHPALHGAMCAFELPRGIDEEQLRQGLWARRIELPVVERPDRLLIRTSTHFYNTEAEVDRLAEVLPDLLRQSTVTR